MEEKLTTLYMVRHGTTALNEVLAFQGRYDEPLNTDGLAQGALLKDVFQNIPIDLGVTSPLKRAKQTMDFIAEGRDFPVIEDPEIMELDGGDIEGRLMQEVNMIYGHVAENMGLYPGQVDMPGGETGPEAYHRMVNAVLRIVKENVGKSIVMTTHGFVIQCWLNYVNGIEAEEMVENTVDNVAVSKFTFDADFNLQVDYIGDSSHLPESLRKTYHWEKINIPRPVLMGYKKCSTCRKAGRFLEALGVDYLYHDLVSDPLNQSEIKGIMGHRGAEDPKKLFNTSGLVYRSLGLKDIVPNMTPEDMVPWLASDGKLVKRPLLVMKDRVLIGFKEEAWREALQ